MCIIYAYIKISETHSLSLSLEYILRTLFLSLKYILTHTLSISKIYPYAFFVHPQTPTSPTLLHSAS